MHSMMLVARRLYPIVYHRLTAVHGSDLLTANLQEQLKDLSEESTETWLWFDALTLVVVLMLSRQHHTLLVER